MTVIEGYFFKDKKLFDSEAIFLDRSNLIKSAKKVKNYYKIGEERILDFFSGVLVYSVVDLKDRELFFVTKKVFDLL